MSFEVDRLESHWAGSALAKAKAMSARLLMLLEPSKANSPRKLRSGFERRNKSMGQRTGKLGKTRVSCFGYRVSGVETRYPIYAKPVDLRFIP